LLHQVECCSVLSVVDIVALSAAAAAAAEDETAPSPSPPPRKYQISLPMQFGHPVDYYPKGT